MILAFAAMVWRARFGAAGEAVGIDYRTFVEEGRRFLAGGPVYLPYQLAGPYVAAPAEPRLDVATVPFLYPPPFILVGVTLALLSNLSSALGLVWWAVPVGLLGYAMARWRPAPWSWPLLAAVLVWPVTSAVVIVGGSTMWAAALVAAGLLWRWPAAFILLKPSLLPFALVGARSRAWWLIAIAIAVLSLPLLSEYVTAMRNATDLRWWYSLGDLPIVLAPVLAWAARSRT